MPENDLRQVIVLHEDEVERMGLEDPWQLAAYGDGWFCWAVSPKDQELIDRRGRFAPSGRARRLKRGSAS